MRRFFLELFVFAGLGYTAAFLQQATPEFTFASIVIVTMMGFAVREVAEQFLAYRAKIDHHSTIPQTLLHGLAAFALYVLIGLVAFSEKLHGSMPIIIFATVALALMAGYAIKIASESWLEWFSKAADKLAMKRAGVQGFDEYLENEPFRKQMSLWMVYWIILLLVAIGAAVALQLPYIFKSGLILAVTLFGFTNALNYYGDEPALVRSREARIRKWFVRVLVIDGLLTIAAPFSIPTMAILTIIVLVIQTAVKAVVLIIFLIQLYLLSFKAHTDQEMSKLDPPPQD